MMMDLPSLPGPLEEYIPYLQQQSRESILTGESLKPFKAYESKLRELFAQEPDNPVLSDPHVNIVPLFHNAKNNLTVKARDLDGEALDQIDKYILPLGSKLRRPDGSPATVQALDEFKKNFKLFSESSLLDLDWSNIVVAGSAVTTCLLPVPTEYSHSRQAQRRYYHELIAPASDVDLFIYGLDEEQAIEKMKEVERCVIDSIPEETTVVRTKNAVTIASKYPIRHVQIVLRLYKSMSEIVTGFDVDCACALFDGSQAWASPRALASFVTQANVIDISRRSPSYENRLAKYSHRGFEVYWADMDRSRIDPTIFDRSFSRVVGLARLLVMEKLPTTTSRDHHMLNRREEQNRPAQSRRRYHRKHRDLKKKQPEDVAEWMVEEDVSDYHTFTVPYGPKYNAKKIENIIYRQDMFLNTTRGRSKGREVNLHRHPAFFGTTEHIIEDCCGFCPPPVTDEEVLVAAEQSKKFVSGHIRFLKDDPGRQAIGSFNPITESDWTEMAYTGNTARFCQAIVERDLETVQRYCLKEGFDIDKRDHAGRMPLHLAIMCSTPAIVECLVSLGARLISRVAGGYTSLHLAAARGDTAIIELILNRSDANMANCIDQRFQTLAALQINNPPVDETGATNDSSDISIVGSETDIQQITTEGSMVDIQTQDLLQKQGETEEENKPNFFDNIDVLSWDTPITPLQLAVILGRNDAVKTLGDRGADVSKPVIFGDASCCVPAKTAVLPLALAINHPPSGASALVETLLSFGASSTQADHRNATALHLAVAAGDPSIIDLLYELDGPAAKIAIDHPALAGYDYNPDKPQPPLSTAIKERGLPMVAKLLEHGAETSISTERLRRLYVRHKYISADSVEHPLVQAVKTANPDVVKALLDARADINAMTPESYKFLEQNENQFPSYAGRGTTVLDLLDQRITELEEQVKLKSESSSRVIRVPELKPDSVYLGGLTEGSYEYWFTATELTVSKWIIEAMRLRRDDALQKSQGKIIETKKPCPEGELEDLRALRELLLEKGAKTFDDLLIEREFKTSDKLFPPASFIQPGYSQLQPPDSAVETFTISYTFHQMDGQRRLPPHYLHLFQAAWEGDTQKFKSLTLGPWGEDDEHLPLQAAVQDGRGFTPFTIAVFREHFELASLILDIAADQYLPQAQPEQTGYQSIAKLDSDGSFGHLNIDQIREVANVVKSPVSPFALIQHAESQLGLFLSTSERLVMEEIYKACPSSGPSWKNAWATFFSLRIGYYTNKLDILAYTIAIESLDTFDFVIKMMEKWRRYSAFSEYRTDSCLYLSSLERYFGEAAERGHLGILKLLITRTGANLPVSTVADIESKAKETATHYQGLSVYGEKRLDWADWHDHRYYGSRIENEPSLVLRALAFYSAKTTKWLLTNEPRKLFIEFINHFKEDPRLEVFHTAEGGFERVISSWITRNSELAVHCAMLSTDRDCLEKIKLALNYMPESLNTRNCDGHTPLMIAASRRLTHEMRILINAGADLDMRDSAGFNVLHHVIQDTKSFASSKEIREMSEILGLDVVRRLAIQRSYPKDGYQFDNWGYLTPLANCLHSKHCKKRESISHNGLAAWPNPFPNHIGSTYEPISRDSLEAWLKATGGQDLYVIDGKGNYPIHHVVGDRNLDLVYAMLEFDPNLAKAENATGITPLDLAESLYVSAIVKHASVLSSTVFQYDIPHQSFRQASNLEKQKPMREYAALLSESNWQSPSDPSPWSADSLPETVLLYMLRHFASKTTISRKLVSYNDACIFSKRIETNRWKEGLEKEDEAVGYDDRDEVSMWAHQQMIR